MSSTWKSSRSSDKGYVTSRHDGKPRPLTLRKSGSERDKRQAWVEGTNRERANVRARDRRRDAAPRCLISASGASEALRQRDQSTSQERATTPPIARAPLPFSSWLPTTQSVRERSRSVISSVVSRLRAITDRDDLPISRLSTTRKFWPGLNFLIYLVYLVHVRDRRHSRSRIDTRSKKKKSRQPWELERGERSTSAIYRWQAACWLTYGLGTLRIASLLETCKTKRKRTGSEERLSGKRRHRETRNAKKGERGYPRRCRGGCRSAPGARVSEIARSRCVTLSSSICRCSPPDGRIFGSRTRTSIPVRYRYTFARNEMRDTGHRRWRV